MKEQDKIELKPCPFCGSEAKLETTIMDVAIKCKNSKCYARILRYNDSGHDIESKWNKRTTSDIENKVSKLKEWIKEKQNEVENYEPEMQIDSDLNDFQGLWLIELSEKISELKL